MLQRGVQVTQWGGGEQMKRVTCAKCKQKFNYYDKSKACPKCGNTGAWYKGYPIITAYKPLPPIGKLLEKVI